MLRFVGWRLWQSLLVLTLMSFVIYALMGLMPGDPIDQMIAADPRLTPADLAELRARYGLDQPILQRYLRWLREALKGNLGFSRLYAAPVLSVMGPALLNTLVLMGSAFILSVLIALPAGIAAAARPYSWIDTLISLIAFAGISLPSFWLALLMIMVFSVMLGVLPAGGLGSIGGGGFLETARFAVLPIASLTLASVGGHIRYVRAAMIETLRQDYIRTARAKGLAPTRVLFGHAMRNGMIPVVTVLALDFGFLFSGALATETIFAYPGMGRLIYDAIMGNDYNLALIALLFATVVTLAGNLLADIAYICLDPRITFREISR